MKMQSIPGKILHKSRMKKAQLNLLTEAAFRTQTKEVAVLVLHQTRRLTCCRQAATTTSIDKCKASEEDLLLRSRFQIILGSPYEDIETSGRDAGSGMPSTFGPWKQASCDAQAIVVGQQHPHPVMASTLLYLFGTTSASELIYPEASFGLRAVCCSHVS